jgi:hypothetical protein
VLATTKKTKKNKDQILVEKGNQEKNMGEVEDRII